MDAVAIDPEVMGGTPCFAGTRVPVQNLCDYSEGGEAVGQFLEDFWANTSVRPA